MSEPVFCGTFYGKTVEGNEAARDALEWAMAEMTRLRAENSDLHAKLFILGAVHHE